MDGTLLVMLTLVMLKSTATWTVRELVTEERKEGKKDREGGREARREKKRKVWNGSKRSKERKK